MSDNGYESFLKKKTQLSGDFGFVPIFMPSFLFDFQSYLVEWAVRKGKSAIFADCGMGKTPMQLVWAENVIRKTNGKVLILTPLSVGHQTMKEAEKFDIEAKKSIDGNSHKNITITNYERLHYFDMNDFVGVVCDESSILKNFDGVRRKLITEFLKKKPYRLLCTATAAPNDYIELGTSSEALGELGYMDMLTRFFKNNQNTVSTRRFGRDMPKWRFKKHAQSAFWRWVSSWARSLRKPSDLGFENNGFILPPLEERETVIACSRPFKGKFFVEPAITLKEQRKERRDTLKDRCECVAEKVKENNDFAVVWCHLNDEGNYIEKIIPESRQVSGSMSDDKKEEIFMSFSEGELKTLITKPKIGAFGLNWQHCAYQTFFPSHSYEQYYQGIRRCWRFGQKRPVVIDIITTEGELKVLKNLQRKSEAADEMFEKLNRYMKESLSISVDDHHTKEERMPLWL